MPWLRALRRAAVARVPRPAVSRSTRRRDPSSRRRARRASVIRADAGTACTSTTRHGDRGEVAALRARHQAAHRLEPHAPRDATEVVGGRRVRAPAHRQIDDAVVADAGCAHQQVDPGREAGLVQRMRLADDARDLGRGTGEVNRQVHRVGRAVDDRIEAVVEPKPFVGNDRKIEPRNATRISNRSGYSSGTRAVAAFSPRELRDAAVPIDGVVDDDHEPIKRSKRRLLLLGSLRPHRTRSRSDLDLPTVWFRPPCAR